MVRLLRVICHCSNFLNRLQRVINWKLSLGSRNRMIHNGFVSPKAVMGWSHNGLDDSALKSS